MRPLLEVAALTFFEVLLYRYGHRRWTCNICPATGSGLLDAMRHERTHFPSSDEAIEQTYGRFEDERA